MSRDYVICILDEDKYENTYLFYAPCYSHLHAKDKVYVDTVNGKKLATVISTITVDKDSHPDIVEFIYKAMKTDESRMRRVISIVSIKDFDYEGFEISEPKESVLSKLKDCCNPDILACGGDCDNCR